MGTLEISCGSLWFPDRGFVGCSSPQILNFSIFCLLTFDLRTRLTNGSWRLSFVSFYKRDSIQQYVFESIFICFFYSSATKRCYRDKVYYCSQSYKLGLSFWFFLFLAPQTFSLSSFFLSSWCLSGGGADCHQQRDISSALLSLRLPLLQCDQLHWNVPAWCAYGQGELNRAKIPTVGFKSITYPA